MTVFEEYFPSEKEIIQKYAERQRKLEELSMALRKSESSLNDRPESLTQRKPSLSMMLSDMYRDTEDELKQSSKVDERIEKIHKIIENIDNVNYIMAPEKEKNFADGSGDDNVAAGFLIDTEDNELSEIVTSKTNQAQKLAKVSEKINNRVSKLKHNDSSLELSDYKPPQIKPTKASILKSKFNSEKFQKNQATFSRSFQGKSTAEPRPIISRAMSLAKYEAPKRVESKSLSQSVRKILDDAKEKHKAKNSLKSNVPVNVVDLFLI